MKLFRNNILKLSQSQFSKWLYAKGLCGRKNEPYNMKTVACWENGRREIPKSVANIITIYEKNEDAQLDDLDIVEKQAMLIACLKAENDMYKQMFERLIGA